MSFNLRTVLCLAATAGLAVGTPVEQKRQGNIGSAIVATVKGILGDLSGFNACYEWAHTTEQDVYWTGGQSSDGSIISVGCFTNSTNPDNSGTDNLFTFAEADRDVANCLTNLHFTQASTCISVGGSSCDLNGYLASGGFIKNSRIGTGSSDAGLTAAQSSAAQDVFGKLVGTVITIDGDNPEIYFYDSDAANFLGTTYNIYQLNMDQGSSTSC